MEQYPPVQLSEETLDLSDDITVSELLQSTGCQCWIISALVNSQRFHEHFVHTHVSEEDALLFKLYKINKSITRDQKSESYRRVNECARLGQQLHREKLERGRR